ncbi:MAG: gfo/Idh/MocA family oxidoreductase, partial [Verrucomicrobiota bacterium]
FWRGSAMRIRMNDCEEEELIECPQVGNRYGYHYEAVEAGECLRLGKLESDVMPLDETFSIMETLDELRSLWGLRYPAEG